MGLRRLTPGRRGFLARRRLMQGLGCGWVPSCCLAARSLQPLAPAPGVLGSTEGLTLDLPGDGVAGPDLICLVFFQRRLPPPLRPDPRRHRQRQIAIVVLLVEDFFEGFGVRDLLIFNPLLRRPRALLLILLTCDTWRIT